MLVSRWDIGEFVPIVALSIPIVAIIGGITAGIIRTLGRQRLIELAQRERIAAIERGVDPTKLAPLPVAALDDEPETWTMSQFDRDRRRAQGLMIGGIVTLAVGIGLMAFLSVVEEHGNAWAVGIIPAAIGIALLLSSFLVRPKGNGGSPLPPQSSEEHARGPGVAPGRGALPDQGVYPTMIDEREFMALLVIWLGFMSVVGVYVVRIGLMLREQRLVERAYRMRLAALRGKAVREMAGRAREPGPPA